MRVLSWNIRAGGGRRLGDIALAIRAHQPDIVVINELRARTGPELRALLADSGLLFEEHTAPTGFQAGMQVASRFPLRRMPPSRPSKVLRHGFLEVEVANWGIIGAVYGPLITPLHARFWNAIVRHTKANVAQPYLLIGDFNTGEAGVDAYLTRMAGSDQFIKIKSAGYVDLWRTTNATTEHTWFSFGRGGVPLNGFRLDHALASPVLAQTLSACRYSHTEREQKLSDHSIVLVDFSPPPVDPLGAR